MTNADRIRAMTDEELARWIVGQIFDIPPGGQAEVATKAWLDWLRQEADNG